MVKEELNAKLKEAISKDDNLAKLSEKDKVKLLVKLGAIKPMAAKKEGITRRTYYRLKK